MIRKIIHIDESKCNGCGICATACHEGAIDIIDGKAKLVRENFCDGLGNCLPACPTGAITFEEREALAYDEAAVKEAMKKKTINNIGEQQQGCACPGSRFASFEQAKQEKQANIQYGKPTSCLGQWPCQIKLLPPKMDLYDGAKILIAADCSAYAYANMHEEFMKGRVTMIGCPKLDSVDYTQKFLEIIANNDVKELTIVRMEVPCCGGLEVAAKNALQASGKFIPWQVVTLTRDGKIL